MGGHPRERVRTGRGHEALRDPVFDVDEAIEGRSPEDAGVIERAEVELHPGERPRCCSKRERSRAVSAAQPWLSKSVVIYSAVEKT